MQARWSFSVAIAVWMLKSTAAVPSPLVNGPTLWNGTHNVVALVSRDLVAEAIKLSARSCAGCNCEGSSLCSGPLINSGQCQDAYNMINPGNMYAAGGSQSGTCSGHCGVFVQSYDGTGGCQLSGAQLQTSFNALRASGCGKCGSQEFGNGCEVTINYVGSC